MSRPRCSIGVRDPDVGLELVPASLGDRLCALAIDISCFGLLLGLPLRSLSDRGHEVTAVAIGCALAALYLGLTVAWQQKTIGHRVMDMAVIDESTLGPASLPRAFGRGLVIAVEVAGSAIAVLLALAIAELSAVAWFGGRSITDRPFGTLVVARRPLYPPSGPE